jgi:hypothetical protein
LQLVPTVPKLRDWERTLRGQIAQQQLSASTIVPVLVGMRLGNNKKTPQMPGHWQLLQETIKSI